MLTPDVLEQIAKLLQALQHLDDDWSAGTNHSVGVYFESPIPVMVNYGGSDHVRVGCVDNVDGVWYFIQEHN